MPAESEITFTCNVCAEQVSAPRDIVTREKASCPHCQSSVRTRSIPYLLSLALYDRAMPTCEFPVDRKISGLGLSDSLAYSKRLEDKFNYQNTYYHQEPFLDITSPPLLLRGMCDFLISSEVFEHVHPPVEAAFNGAFFLLKPGGTLVLTVPFRLSNETTEHFPELHEFEIVGEGATRTLINRTHDGRVQEFTDLKFHGGIGNTLEMRLFCRADLIGQLERAGFTDIFVMEKSAPEWGILYPQPWSTPILARRPRTG